MLDADTDITLDDGAGNPEVAGPGDGKLTAMVGQEVNVNLTGTTFVAAKDDGDGPLFDEGGEAPDKKPARQKPLDGTR